MINNSWLIVEHFNIKQSSSFCQRKNTNKYNNTTLWLLRALLFHFHLLSHFHIYHLYMLYIVFFLLCAPNCIATIAQVAIYSWYNCVGCSSITVFPFLHVKAVLMWLWNTRTKVTQKSIKTPLLINFCYDNVCHANVCHAIAVPVSLVLGFIFASGTLNFIH